VILSFTLLLYCLVTAGAYLFVVSTVLDLVERRLKLLQGVPPELIEPHSLGAIVTNFVLESLFLVVIPTIVYGFFFSLLPFFGVRAGMAAALFAFALGVTPTVMSLSIRIRLPMPYLLFAAFSLLVKLSGCLIIIAWLYSL
jgi:hypothetical protein